MDHPIEIILSLVFIVVALFWGPIVGSTVSLEKAQTVAHQQLSPDAEIGGRTVWFVNWKGCEKGEVVKFYVMPYVGKDGTIVDNAMICSGWLFKGMTPRFK